MYTSSGILHSEMVRILRDRVEDSKDLAFSLQQKYDALDKAKRYIASVVHNKYLTNLETTATVESNQNGIISIGSLSDSGYRIFRNEILRVTAVVDQMPREFKKIEYSELKGLDNYYLYPDLHNPIFYVWSDKIYLLPKFSYTVEVSFLEEPKNVIENQEGVPDYQEYCTFDASLIDAILDFSEATLWKMDNEPERARLVEETGTNLINLLNERYNIDREPGLGNVGGS